MWIILNHVHEFIENQLKELGIVNTIKFQSISSPREYNFVNDSGNIEIELTELNILAIQEYIKTNETNYRQYLADTYTSYDGFISSYSNEVCDWYEYTNDFSDFSGRMHYLGSILEFICKNEGITDDMMYNFLEIYNSEYCIDRKDQVKCEECDEWYKYEIDEKAEEYNHMLYLQKALWKKTQKGPIPKQKSFKECNPEFRFLCNKCKPKEL